MSELRDRFEHDGFVVLPGFADVSACAELRDAAHEIVAAQDLSAIETVFDAGGQRHGEDLYFLDSGGEVRAFLEPERDGDQRRVNKLGHAMHDRLPVFDRFSRNPRLAALVAELGVVEPLLLQSMVIFKHPRIGGAVPAHQDATYLYTEPVSVIGLWFALEPATRDNGCLELLPGGHRLAARGAIPHDTSLGLSAAGFVAETCSTPGTAAFRLRASDENSGARSRDGLRHGLLGLRKRYRRSGDRAWTQELDPRPWPREGWLPIEAEVGTLVAFHGLLPHRSRANRSSHSRCAYTLHVIDGACAYASDNWLQRPAELPLRGF